VLRIGIPPSTTIEREVEAYQRRPIDPAPAAAGGGAEAAYVGMAFCTAIEILASVAVVLGWDKSILVMAETTDQTSRPVEATLGPVAARAVQEESDRPGAVEC
jgi:hypothetical protein